MKNPVKRLLAEDNKIVKKEFITPKTHTNMKTLLLQIADLISGQQQDISRLISEVERNGQRSDRVLNLIEHHCETTDSSGSKKKSGIL